MTEHRSPSRNHAHTAYTLIEVLAVVVLMGLVFAALVPNLVGASDRAGLDRLVAELIDLDGRARLLATHDGACLIEHELGAGKVSLRVPAVELSQTYIISAPPAVGIEIEGDEQRVVFDGLGESRSYSYLITAPSTRIRLAFNGQSGWYELRRGDGHE